MIKQQPQAIDLEKAVLGAILIERDALSKVVDLLKPEMFYHSFHSFTYEKIISLYATNQPIDTLTLTEFIGQDIEKAGGVYYLTTLTNSVVSSMHIEAHTKKIVEKYLLREQIRIGSELMQKGYDETDPFENIEQAEKSLQVLTNAIQTKDSQQIDTVLVEVIQELETLRHREHYLIGATSGYRSVDKITMGWQKSDLIIIAARPAVGKTAFTLSLGTNAAMNKKPVAFFSLEMSSKQLVKRQLASTAKMYLSTIKSARLDDSQMKFLYDNGIQKLAGIPFYIDDTASMTVLQFKARLRRLVRKYGVEMCIVDYLQLLKSTVKNGNRQQQIGEISRELKITSKELDIPILALSQLSREVEKHNRTPQLSDLREAGDIEQDADMVMFLYGHNEKVIEQDKSLENEIFLKFAKHRNGSLGNLKFTYDKDYQIFTEDGEVPEFKPVKNYYTEDNPF
jgi:replicative DNA helicase